MAARSLFLGISAVLALCLGGCASRPTTCYVTLSAGGQPTAEACETGPVLMVRPITQTNAAYYVPPYVLGALSYEGFLAPPQSTEGSAEAGRLTEVIVAGKFADEGAYNRSRSQASSALEEAIKPTADDTQGAPASVVAEDTLAARSARGPEPANRIAPDHARIDGEVRYRRPYEGMPTTAIAPDLLL